MARYSRRRRTRSNKKSIYLSPAAAFKKRQRNPKTRVKAGSTFSRFWPKL